MVNRSEAGEYDRTGSCNRKLKVGKETNKDCFVCFSHCLVLPLHYSLLSCFISSHPFLLHVSLSLVFHSHSLSLLTPFPLGGSCGKNRVYNSDRRCVSVGSRCDFHPCPVGMNTRACRPRAGVVSVNGTCLAAPALSSPPPAKHVLHFDPSLQQQSTSTVVETTNEETFLSKDESWDTAMWPATPLKSFFFLDE
jgi:hypothetical protein